MCFLISQFPVFLSLQHDQQCQKCHLTSYSIIYQWGKTIWVCSVWFLWKKNNHTIWIKITSFGAPRPTPHCATMSPVQFWPGPEKTCPKKDHPKLLIEGDLLNTAGWLAGCVAVAAGWRAALRHSLIQQNNASDSPLCPNHVMPSQAQRLLPAMTSPPYPHTEGHCAPRETPANTKHTSSPLTSPPLALPLHSLSPQTSWND